ncbi:hypothetical protein JHL18_17555 [Clostridium sp. YIM B02505]|uniref:Uncharacterized protein n=1 Tax=Clostridium yunnanense TaxID=2800325 RepID=A0ABS1ESY3_9CLOT|nr:hypothetical protein [Clostridium yunnanense]MBK1812435.1 hypothetical protein [Clostridium yunnanense]
MNDGRKQEVENRIDQIVDTVEKYTRTERHIEQNQDIISSEQLEHAKEIQNARKREIDTLKDKIVYGDNYKEDEQQNIIDNMINAAGYIKNNGEDMSEKDLNNIKDKQANRKDQLETF